MRTQKWICGAVFTVMSAGLPAYALDHELSYYPQEFYSQVNQNQLRDEALKTSLFQIVSKAHVPGPNGHDQLQDHCTGTVCKQHVSLGYKGARRVLFGELHLQHQNNGQMGVEEIYCHDIWTNNGIPDESVMNTEHTWPQSRFTGKYGKDVQKSDLHHLFPTTPNANSTRGSFEFGDVVTVKHAPCAPSKLGYGEDGSKRLIFQVPDDHKGDTARAIFYFSVRYQIKISAEEERSLKAWHKLDPVDAFEAHRNEGILLRQGNRNPFIDHPELVELISDF